MTEGSASDSGQGTVVSRFAPPRPVVISFDQHSVPAFLMKLYTMLEDTCSDDIISWGPTGDSFVVRKLPEFAALMLPQFFKHSNFQSFVRQLNLYGFHKLKQAPDWNEFGHIHFRQGHKELLKNIKRKPVQNSSKSKAPNSPTRSESPPMMAIPTMSMPHPATFTGPSDKSNRLLLERLASLERQNDLAVHENRMLWRELYSIHESHDEINARLEEFQNLLSGVHNNRLQGCSRPQSIDSMTSMNQSSQSTNTGEKMPSLSLNGTTIWSSSINTTPTRPPPVLAPSGLSLSPLLPGRSASPEPMSISAEYQNSVRADSAFEEWIVTSKSMEDSQAELIKRIGDMEKELADDGIDLGANLFEFLDPYLV